MSFRITQCFENNYIHGKIRKVAIIWNVNHTSPLFPPEFWSIYEQMKLRISRIQNSVETWHQHLETLIGKSHVNVYTIVNELKRE